MAQLTDIQKKQIIAEAAEGWTCRDQAKKWGVSATTIVRVRRADPDFKQKVAKKQEEIGNSILEHMDQQRPKINTLLDDMLEMMSDKEKQKKATLVQLATTMGILIDKFTIREQNKRSDEELNNLFVALGRIDITGAANAIPELQHETESVDAVVEGPEVKE